MKVPRKSSPRWRQSRGLSTPDPRKKASSPGKQGPGWITALIGTTQNQLSRRQYDVRLLIFESNASLGCFLLFFSPSFLCYFCSESIRLPYYGMQSRFSIDHAATRLLKKSQLQLWSRSGTVCPDVGVLQYYSHRP